MKLKRKIICAWVLCSAFTVSVAGEKPLTFQQSFLRGEPRLMTQLPRIEKWLDDQTYLAYPGGEGRGNAVLYKVDVRSGAETPFMDWKALSASLPKGLSLERPLARSADLNRALLEKDDDLYYYDISLQQLKQLTRTPAKENTPRLSPDQQWVAYTRDNNLFVTGVTSGVEKQLTLDGSATILNGWASWVYYEEILGRRSQYCAFWWSPNSEMIAFLRFDDATVPVFTLVKADGIHGELEVQRYPKAGDANPKVRLGIAHVRTGRIVWVDTDAEADHYLAWPFWTPDSRQLLFQWMNRGQDHLVLYSAVPETGVKKLIYEERQPSWVEFFEDITFVDGGKSFLLRSNVDGWSHLYHYRVDGTLIRRITRGNWDVRGIEHVDEKKQVIYFSAADMNPVEKHLYRIDFSGKNMRRLTAETGAHTCSVSPHGRFFIDTYNSAAQPGRMVLKEQKGAVLRTIADQKLPAMDEYNLGVTEMFTIPSGDGYDLPAKWTLPPDLDFDKKYPVLFQIYGGPGAPSVSHTYPRLSAHFMAQQGIIVFSVDHRGAGHFGKKAAGLMHRQLGKYEMQDYIAAVKWLRSIPFVDSTRIGITGGSYGGYATLMAMTAAADYFTHGLAEFSVTDWRLYDSVYTERFMDTPAENPDGYTAASVLTHADKLKGPLYISHGTMDDNVHMQNTLQLVDKWQDLDKEFTLMLYPNGRHGIRPPKDKHVARDGWEFWREVFNLNGN